MKTLKIVFMGTPDFAVPTLGALLKAGHEVVSVVTQPDRKRGRGKSIRPCPVKSYALKHDLNILQPECFDAGYISQLVKLGSEAIVVVAYGKILTEEILNLPKYGCINVHASVLPKYRGAAPIHRAIINGETESGVTIMRLDKGMDTGPMLKQEKVSISDTMTAGELHDRLAQIGAELLVKTLECLPNLVPKEQVSSLATYAAMLTKEDECLDWEQKANNVVNRIRGMNPWPGAYTILDNKRLKIHQAQVFPFAIKNSRPGTIVETNNKGFVVAAGDEKGVLVTMLQPEGKQKMPAADFLRGYFLSPGTKFSSRGDKHA